MKQILRLSFALAMLLSHGLKGAVLPYLSIRSQSINDARELVGWQTQINKADMCSTYGSFSITPEYERSFHSDRIAQALFCNALTCNCCERSSLKIQGTKVANRDPKALMAENFYLSTDYNSVLTIEPRIDNFLVDFNMYIGLGAWHEGLFLRMHAPVVYTRWDLNFNESILNDGTYAYDPGYFNNSWTNNTNPQGLPREFLLNSFAEFATDGRSIASVNGITFDPLINARWSRCRKTLTSVADLRMQLGWNFLSCPNYHLGVSFYAAAPTGNRPLGQFLFEPIVGNGKHWEVGAGITGHTNMWKSEDECCSTDVYVDANITHLFKTRQCRTFDLVDKPLSRYMLAMKLTDQVNNLSAADNGTFKIPSAQFANHFIPVANFSTIPVNVSAAVQADVVLKFAWTYCNFQWDLGYNLWARSCEKISRYTGPCCFEKFPLNTYALKGNAFVYGFPGTLSPLAIDNEGVPLSATQSQATIFGGTDSFANPNTWSQNNNIDNPLQAYDNPAGGARQELFTDPILPPAPASEPPVPPSTSWFPVNTSVDPVFIKEADLDLAGGQQRGISNKLFTHFGYTWNDHCGWIPFVGLGGEVEWGKRNKNSDCENSCNNTHNCHKIHKTCNENCCQDFALSQWGVWFKGGVSFN